MFRKEGKRPKVTKAMAIEVAEHLEFMVRVRRPELESFIIDGEFWNLPILSGKCIDNKGHRLMRHKTDGWAIPTGSLGRSGTVNRSTAQSVRLWIEQNLGAYVPIDVVSIVVQ